MFQVVVCNVLAHIAVPIFFVISGYLFFNNFEQWNNSKWINKLRRRITTLLVPYIIWNVIYLIYTQTWPVDIRMFWDSHQWNIDRVDIWGNPYISTSPVLVPLWFIRNLLVVIVFSPLFYVCFNDKNRIRSQISILCMVGLYLSQTSLFINGFDISSFFFFGLGVYLKLSKKEIFTCFISYRSTIYIICLILFFIETIFNGNETAIGSFIYPFYILFAVLSFFHIVAHFSKQENISNWSKKCVEISKKYAKATFFIYAIHTFLLQYSERLVSKPIRMMTGVESLLTLDFCNLHPWYFIMFFIAKVVITVVLSILLYNVLSLFLPRVGMVVCGNYYTK